MDEQGQTNTLKVEILAKSDFEDFFRVGHYVETELKLPVIEKLNDFDTMYWTINYNGHNLVLSYNTTFGIYIFCNEGSSATIEDEGALLELSKKLKEFVVSI